jgi:hypothetical protein
LSISRPHPSQNLISLYGLDPLASTVARKDPVTGEKINKLRKSYEGKVKNLGLPGKNKPTDRPGELLGFMEWPEDAWYDQKIRGKELDLAQDGPMMKKLAKALQMNPGKLLPEDDAKWKGLLAYDEASVKTPVVSATKRPAHQAMLKSQPSSMRASAPASPRAQHGARLDRPNKKRSYVESSYEGYQDDDGYSTGGLDDKHNSAAKKRRKVCEACPSLVLSNCHLTKLPSQDFSPALEGSNSSFKNGVLGLGLKSS